jgi:hypothetical protein
MAKIVIFEGGSFDTCFRYGFLVPNHDVHVYMLTRYFNTERAHLVQNGFEKSQIYPVGPKEEIISADIYFLDGLEGKCLDFFPSLPKGKAFLVSGGLEIEAKVSHAGYQVASEGQVSQLVEKISIV